MFELNEVKCRLVQYVPRRELHGEEPKPAATLKLQANLESGILACFHPTLRSFLYTKAAVPPEGADLADQGSDMPDLRFPQIAGFKWALEIEGAELTIDYGLGGAGSNIVLPGCKVDAFSLAPAQGGMVQVAFSVGCHPDEAQSGKLAFMIGDEITVTLEPPGDDAE